MALEQLDKGDNFRRVLPVVEGNMVRATSTVKPDEASQSRYVMVWMFDFTDVSREELLALCAKPLTIIAQRIWRASADRFADHWGTHTWSVRDLLDRERAARAPVDPRAAALKHAKGMTPEALASFIADLEAANEEDAS